MKQRPIVELAGLPDRMLVLAWCADRDPSIGGPLPMLYAVDRLREVIAAEPGMPRHLQFGFTHFVPVSELFEEVTAYPAKRWHEMEDEDIYSHLFEVAGALRRKMKHGDAKKVQFIADKFYPGKIKPAPIIPRTHHG